MLAMLVFAATPAFSATLVSNADKFANNANESNAFYAQSFRTGSQGATLSDIQIRLGTSGSSISVRLREDNGSGQPNMNASGLVATLTNPNSLEGNKLNKFTVPTSNTVKLAAGTTYWISVHEGISNAKKFLIQNNSDDETTAETGWSIDDTSLLRSTDSGSWSTDPDGLVIEVNGTLNSAPTVANEIPDQSATEAMAFSYAFPENTFSDSDTNPTDTLTYSAVKSDDSGLPAWLSFNATTRTFSGTPTGSDLGTVSVKVTADDGYGGTVSDTFDIAVTADTTAPMLSTAEVSDDSLTLTYNEDLDTGSTPAAGDFTVKVAGSSVSLANTNPVAISGKTVTLTLASGVTHGQMVTVSYTAGTNPIRDKAATPNNAANLSGESVTNSTPDTTAPMLSTAEVNDDSLTLTYDEELDTGSTPAAGDFTVTAAGSTVSLAAIDPVVISGAVVTLKLTSAVTSGQTVTVSYTPGANPIQDKAVTPNPAVNLTSHAVMNKTAPKLTGAEVNGAKLTLTYDGNLDESSVPAKTAFTVKAGVYVPPGANPSSVTISGKVVTLTLATAASHGETVTVSYTPGANPIKDTSGNAAAGFTGKGVTNSTPDTTAPTLLPQPLGAAVNGETLTLTYNENLDESSVPADSAFTVKVDGSEVNLLPTPRTPVAISGAVVTLRLIGGVKHGQKVTVSYTAPDTDLIQDIVGNKAGDLTDRAVMNRTADITGPKLAGAVVTDAVLRLTYNENLDESSVPPAADFTVKADSNVVLLANTNPVSISGRVVTLMLGRVVTNVEAVRVSYVVRGDYPIQDTSYNAAEDFTNQKVTNGSTPTFTGAEVNGATLTLTYNEELDTSSVPAASAFTVKAGSSTVSLAATNPVVITDKVVTLTLARTVGSGQTVTVSYEVPDTDPIQGTSGNKAVNLTSRRVTNNTEVANRPPTAANPIPDREATTGTAFSYTFPPDTFSDPDGDTLTYRAVTPSWLRFFADDRAFSGTPGADDAGTVSVTVTADDGRGGSVSDTFNITVSAEQTSVSPPAVNSPPTVAEKIPDQSATEGLEFGYTFPDSTFSDADEDTLTYSAAVNDNGSLPSWLTFNNTARTFSGTPSAEDVGTLSVKVTADDGGGGSVNDTFNITVAAANKAPTVASQIPDQSATEGLEFGYTFPESTFSDADEDTLTYSAVTNDDGALPSWLGFDNSTRTFSGTPSAEDVGTLSVKVTADDGRGGAVSDTFNITVAAANKAPTVANEIPDQTAMEGLEFRYRFEENTFNDADNDTLTYIAVKGDDGALPAWLGFDSTARTFLGTPSAEDVGTLSVKVTADDGRGGSVSDTFNITVSAAPVVPAAQRRALKRAMAALGASTVAGALGNINTRFADSVPQDSLTLGGQPIQFGSAGTEHGSVCLGTDMEECEQNTYHRSIEAGDLLYASDFSLAVGEQEGRPFMWSVWGRGDLGTFSGKPETGMGYDGDTRTGWLGADVRGAKWVAGLAVSHGRGESDYHFDGGDDPGERGSIESTLTALYPYGSLTFGNGLELKAVLGAGWGEMKHKSEDIEEQSDLFMWMGSLGFRQQLSQVAGIELAAKGDATFARISTGDGKDIIDDLSADIWRGRAGLEMSRGFKFGDSEVTPFMEVSARRDGGDGLAGTGLELAGGLRYSASRLEVEARGRWLAAHTESGAEESGLSFTARLGAGERERGLSFALTPRWGGSSDNTEALWREELPDPAGVSLGSSAELDAQMGYGMSVFGGGFTGTPNVGVGLSEDTRRLLVGWRLTPAEPGEYGFELAIDATRSEYANGDAPEHGVELHGTVRW